MRFSWEIMGLKNKLPLSDLISEGLDEGDVVLNRLQGDGAVLHVGGIK